MTLPQDNIQNQGGLDPLSTQMIHLCHPSTPEKSSGITEPASSCLFCQAVEVSIDGILLRDTNERIIYANQALRKMFDYTIEEIVGKNVLVLFPGETHQYIKQEIFPVVYEQGIWRGEVEAQDKNGKSLLVSVSTSCLTDSFGKPTAYVSVYRDISHEREIQQQLTQSEKLAAMGEMLAAAAHELNNPLTTVVGFSQLLLRKRVSSDIKRQLKKISSEALRTSKIVKNFLSLARPSKPEKILVGVNGVIQHVLELKRRQLKVDNIRVLRKLDPNLPKVIGDYQQLFEVFLNLINNAHQAMVNAHGKGTLTMRTETTKGEIFIHISDTGPGIPIHVQQRLFKWILTTKPEGTGLGLRISYDIIKKHDGEITVLCPKSRGSTFTIRLPVGQPDSRTDRTLPAKPVHKHEPAAKTKPTEILVVDDEEMILDLYHHLLTQLGFRCDLVKSGNDALDRLNKKVYDLIIADVKIPRMSGKRFYSLVQQSHPPLSKRFIFVTGDAVDKKTHQFIESNHLDVLYKPFVLNQLEQIIQRVLNKGELNEPRTNPHC